MERGGKARGGAASNRGNASGRRANARSNPPPVRATPPTSPTAPAPAPAEGCPRIRPGSAPGSARVANPGSARVANPGSARVANPGSARVATLVATLASLGPVACRPPVDDGGGREARPRSKLDPRRGEFPMHAAAYYGDVDALRSAVLDALARDAADHSESREYDLREPEDSPLAALDACGNTPLHVAVLRRRRDAVIALLDDDRWDYPVEARSGGGWTALQEATHMGSRWMTRRLFAATLDRSKREFERSGRGWWRRFGTCPIFAPRCTGSLAARCSARCFACTPHRTRTRSPNEAQRCAWTEPSAGWTTSATSWANRRIVPCSRGGSARVFASPRRRRRRRVGEAAVDAISSAVRGPR